MQMTIYVEILEKNLFPFVSNLEQNAYIFQEDNAPIHTAKVVVEWKDENMIGIRQQTPPPKNMHELADAVKEEWFKLDSNYLENLVESMSRRIKAVIESKGNPTNY